jgi:hypothetical protein
MNMTTYDWKDDDIGIEVNAKSLINHYIFWPLLSSFRHFLRFIMTFLSISALLVGGLSFWHADMIFAALGVHTPMSSLEHSGAKLLSVSELKNHISLPTHEEHRRHWIGPLAGTSYTTNCITPGVLKVNYFASAQSFSDASQPLISVTSYESQALYSSQLRPLTDGALTIVTNSRGDILSYDPTVLTQLKIAPKSSQEVITFVYSTPQSVMSMIHDSENLVQL